MLMIVVVAAAATTSDSVYFILHKVASRQNNILHFCEPKLTRPTKSIYFYCFSLCNILL